MATTEFKKVIILGHKEEKNRLLDKIHRVGLIEIINLKDQKSNYKDLPFLRPKSKEIPLDFDSIIKELQCSIDFLKGFEEKKSLFEKLTQKRPVLNLNNAREILSEFNSFLFCKKVEEIEHTKKELDVKKDKLIQEKNELSPWSKLNVPLEDIGRTEHTLSHIGTIYKDKYLAFKNEITEQIPGLIIEEINQTPTFAFLYILYLKTEEEKTSGLLKRYGFNYVYFYGLQGIPKEIVSSIDRELSKIEKEKAALFETAKTLLDKKEKITILYDYFNNLKRRELVLENFLYTEDTFILEGWVRKRDIGRLKAEVGGIFKTIEIIIKNPSKVERPPVELENKRVFEPFEFVTSIYGLPAQNEVDPTPFLAPFFFIFFGMCLSDVGYGLILSVLSWFILKRFKMGPRGMKFFKLFFYCGISTIIIGALTGGWFGNIIDMLAESGPKSFLFLKAIKDRLIILDPQKEPMKLLIVALCLGVIQIWSGYIIAIYGNLKNKRFLDAIFDQGSILLFLAGFTGLLLTFFGVFGKTAMPIFLKIFVSGGLFIILTQGRSNPGIGSKLFFGIYSLYSAFSGYISDVLSYSRLWALGLVTGVMAYTCNLVAFMVGGVVPYIGILFAVLILVFGHFITLIMNLLGAFVHPLRLQFVEFFSKFFRGGGRPFRPLAIESRYTVFEK